MTASVTPHRAVLVAMVGALGLALAACGGGDAADPLATSAPGAEGRTAAAGQVVVGSADFSESKLLAEIYHGALQAKGVNVGSPRLGIGAREAYLRGLSDGSINVIPEYTGALAVYYDQGFAATEPDQVYEGLKGLLPDGLTVLAPSQAQNKDSVTVRKDLAEQHQLSTIGDLAPVAGRLVLGAQPEFKTRQQGVPGLERVYGVTFEEVRSLKGQALVQALANDQVDAANIFTTDPAIKANGFVVLEDDKNLFGAQNIVPLVTTAVAADPRVTETLDAVSAKLTTQGLQDMLVKVDIDKQDPGRVADEFLEAQDLA